MYRVPRAGQRAVTQITPSEGDNLHIIGGVSSGTGVIVLKNHNGAIHKEENARFVANIFVAALNTHEYRELPTTLPQRGWKRTRALLGADGIMNGHKLVICRLTPYNSTFNPKDSC